MKLTASLLRCCLALGAFLLLPGCAFAEVRVNLDPSPTVASTEGLEREVIVFPSIDRRPNLGSCGARRNSYGADVGRVRCTMAPTQWLNEAILRGLQRRNFRIVTLLDMKSKAPLRVNLTLQTLFIDQVLEGNRFVMLTDVEVHVSVQTDSGLLAERTFFVREREFDPSESSFQATLLLASRELATAVLDAITELADRYPGLGKVEQPLAARGPK